MDTREHLLICLAEECAEVAQRVSKALRFGLEEIQPGQRETNADRIVAELADLWAVTTLLEHEGAFKAHGDHFLDLAEAKRDKLAKFMKYSVECGMLEPLSA